MKQTALVICPGRGTYGKEELGYFRRYHSDKRDLIEGIDAYRSEKGQVPISELDAASAFTPKDHTRGDNASALIYACAYADFLSIDRDKFDIVAVTGNSMGWYIALSCGGAISANNGTHIINTMGTFMQNSMIGGQLIYIYVDDDWQEINGAYQELMDLVAGIKDLHLSINLGGMVVFGGTDEALKQTEAKLETRGNFPFRLINHAAFHTPLQQPISKKAMQHFDAGLFDNPDIPLIDGRGHIWTKYSTNADEIFNYTFAHQVTRHYDFTKAVQVSVKEYAPDKIIILGSGSTLGGAVAQSLIDIKWLGLESKQDFTELQSAAPHILSMGIEEQRSLVIK